MTQTEDMDPIDKEVGRYLLEHKVLDRDKIQEAIEHSKKEGVGFRRALLALDLVDLEFLQRFLPKDVGQVRQEDIEKIQLEIGAAAAAEAEAEAPKEEPKPKPKPGLQGSSPSMIIPKGEGGPPKRLGEYLVDDEVIDEDQLSTALDYAKENGVFLGSALVSMRYVDEDVLSRYIIRQRQDLQRGKRGRPQRLGEILVGRKLLTEAQLQEMLEAATAEGKRLGEVLIEKGVIKEVDLALALSEQLMIPVVNLRKNPPDPGVAVMVSRKLVTKHQALPYRKEGELMTVAMVDPLNIMALDDFKSLTQCEVMPVIVTRKDFDESVKNFLGGEEEELLEWFSGPGSDEDGAGAEDFNEVDQAPIVQLVNKVVGTAVKRGVSDIHIEPLEDRLTVRFRVDGSLKEFTKAPPDFSGQVAARIKVMASLNVAETRLPQDGKFRLKIGGNVVDFRVSILPLVTGEKIVMRILDQSKARVKLADLGLTPLSFKWFTDDGIYRPNGIVLVTGPTGSGKTSTLYAGLMAIANPKTNIHTAEDPVEFTLPGVTQVQVHPEWGLDFASVLKSFLRQDPDVILLGEIRDVETARIALKAAMTGHLVLSTLHTNDAISTIDRFLSMGIDRFLIGTALKVVLAQRLVKKLCEACCEVDPEGRAQVMAELGDKADFLIEQAGFEDPASIVVRKAVGCETCEGIGFMGRTGIFEVIRFDDELAERIVNGESNAELYEYARSTGMVTLREAAMIRVLQGVTSVSEMLRLTVPEPSRERRDEVSFLEEEGEAAGGGGGAAQAELLAIRESLAGLESLARGAPGNTDQAAMRILSLFRETWGEGDLQRPQARIGMERLSHYLETFEAYAASRRKAVKAVDLKALLAEKVTKNIKPLCRKAMLLNEKRLDPASFQVLCKADVGPVQTDPALLGEALEHLVLNSIQAMPEGGKIKVAGRRAGDTIELIVADTGAGLPEASLRAAQEAFHAGRPYGLGLGLPIVHKRMADLGGTLELKSVPGKGTMATLRFPAG